MILRVPKRFVVVSCFVLAVVLIATRTHAQPSAVPMWQTIKTATLSNQTAPISSPYTLYTPAVAGTYRVSYFVEPVSTTLPNNVEDLFYPGVTYTDDSGQAQNSLNIAWANPAFAYVNPSGMAQFQSYGSVFVLHSKAGFPIGISVTGNASYSSTYNVILTIERLTSPQ
jgi:hypothetical protein